MGSGSGVSPCVFQGDHHVAGGLRAEDEPGDREERLPGERAGREGESAGVRPEAEGRGQRWRFTDLLSDKSTFTDLYCRGGTGLTYLCDVIQHVNTNYIQLL